MSVVLDREYVNLAIKLGCVSVRDYVEFIVDIENFREELKR